MLAHLGGEAATRRHNLLCRWMCFGTGHGTIPSKRLRACDHSERQSETEWFVYAVYHAYTRSLVVWNVEVLRTARKRSTSCPGKGHAARASKHRSACTACTIAIVRMHVRLIARSFTYCGITKALRVSYVLEDVHGHHADLSRHLKRQSSACGHDSVSAYKSHMCFTEIVCFLLYIACRYQKTNCC